MPFGCGPPRDWRRAGERRSRQVTDLSARGGFGIGGDVFFPVDRRGIRAVEYLQPARLGEVVPAPVDERVDAVADTGHEHGVEAYPGRTQSPRAVRGGAIRLRRSPRRGRSWP